MKLLIVMILLILIYVVFILFFEEKISYALYFFSIIVIRVYCIQFLYYVNLIEERLHTVDKNLLSMEQLCNATNSRCRINEHIETECYNRIVTLKTIYGQLWEITTLINAYFGWPLLIIAIEYFVELVANAYLIYLGINAMDQLSEYNIKICIGVLPVVFTFNVVCVACHWCTKSVCI